MGREDSFLNEKQKLVRDRLALKVRNRDSRYGFVLGRNLGFAERIVSKVLKDGDKK